MIGHAWRLLHARADSLTPAGSRQKPIAANDFGAPLLMSISDDMAPDKCSAYEAFDPVSTSSLKVLSVHRGVDLKGASDAFDVRKAMVDHYLKDESIEYRAGVLEKYVAEGDPDPIASIMHMPEVADCFGEDEVKILSNWKKEQAKKVDESTGYKKKLATHMITVAKNGACGKLKSGRKDPTSSRFLVSDGTRLIKEAETTNALSEVRAFLFLFCF